MSYKILMGIADDANTRDVHLLLCAGLLYRLLQTTERRFAKSQFTSISERALKDCFGVVNRQRLTTESLATMIGHQFDNSSEWPFVVVNGFETIVNALSRSGSTSTMGFAPIVEPGEEQEKWEVCPDLFSLAYNPI
jgi:hypothetical protein